MTASPLQAQELRWDLKAIYASPEAWDQARTKLSARLPELQKFQGHLGDSAPALWEAFQTWLELRKEADRLSAYASMLADQDTRQARPAQMNQQAQDLQVQLGTAAAYIQPELLQLGAPKVRALVEAEPKLKAYAPVFEEILEAAPHTLSPAEETLVAKAGNLTGQGGSIRDVFSDADFPYPKLRIGKENVTLDAAAYTRYRAVPQRTERIKVFKTFWGRYQDYKRTLAATLNAQVQAHIFERDVHKYKSCLEASLKPEHIPTEVYHQLLRDVDKGLPTLHRYLRLRQKLMKLPNLGYEDLYAPIVPGVSLRFTPAEAQKLALESAAPLGSDYVKVLGEAFQAGWTDWLPSPGKRSGAYSNGGVYDVHPYQLLNFNGNYEDVSTLAHESGHSLHSYLSNKTQPYGLNDYSLFVAEVASTLNENLLFHHMLKRAKTKKEKLFLLGSYLEGMRTTLFRQTLLAEFELKIHEQVEGGEPLTGEGMNELYLKLLRRYYGHDKGVCKIDETYAVEWAYIPHFYYNFYVYQYATSMVASTSIAKAMRANPEITREAYLKMLSSGSSKYPIDLLKGVGVDMTTSAPFEAAMEEMNSVMDQIEALTGKP